MSPAASIVVPCWRAARWLPALLDSVAAQTVRDWELVVVLDGPDPEAEAIVRRRAPGLPGPVEVVALPANRGLSAARNAGLAAARAPWVAWLDADDLWEPRHLETLLATAGRHGADLAHATAVEVDADTGRELGRRGPTAEELADFPASLWRRNYIQPSAALTRAAAMRAIGGFAEDVTHVQDIECWFRAARAGWRFAHTGEATCLYRRHPGAMANDEAAMAEAKALVLWRHRDWGVVPPAVARARLADQAYHASRQWRARDPRRAARLAWLAARADPPGARPLLAMVVALARCLAGGARRGQILREGPRN